MLPDNASPTRLIIGISGASGAVYGLRLLQRSRELGAYTHLVVTAAGWLNINHELDMGKAEFHALANEVHAPTDVGAKIASGSYPAQAMVIAPCSMKTLASVALGLSDNLLTRAADVMLKERRRLIIMPRETPLNLAHLRHMTSVTEMGGVVFPALPAFYHRPQSLAELVDDSVDRVLQLCGLGGAQPKVWMGL